MSTWVLILTIVGSYGQAPSSINSIPGFSDHLQCTSAGQVWLRSVSGPAAKTTFVCVEQKK